SDSGTVDDPAFQEEVTGLQADLVALGDVLAGPPVSYFDVAAQSPENAAGLVSQDRRAALISVPLTDSGDASIEDLRAVADGGTQGDFTVQVAGPGTLGADFTTIAE